MGGTSKEGSESYLWRMDILISVGASEYGLDRLLKIIDDLCEEGILEGKHIIAQRGTSKYTPKNFKSFKLIARDEYQAYMDNADVIISHAGTGSVIPPLKMGKKVIVFPRREKFGEHIDDHQLELAEIFTAAGCTMCATNKEDMIECIRKLETFTPAPFKSNTAKMNKLIIDYIESL